MPDHHANFDAAKLFERKNHHCGFRFCPLCGLEMREGPIDGRSRMYCVDDSCGYIFYQNPIPARNCCCVGHGPAYQKMACRIHYFDIQPR